MDNKRLVILKVALDTPLRRLFDYLPPGGLAHSPPTGVRVRVPFGRRHLIGVVLGTAADSSIPPDKLKSIDEYLDVAPVFDPTTLELLHFAIDYYHHPPGEVVAAALPAALRDGGAIDQVLTHWTLTESGMREHEAATDRRAPQQRALLAWLAARGPATADEVGVAFNRDLLKALARRGWIASRDAERPMPSFVSRPSELAPTAAQTAVIDAIVASLGAFSAHLLYGVTGSGKTEVYLRCIERRHPGRRPSLGVGA